MRPAGRDDGLRAPSMPHPGGYCQGGRACVLASCAARSLVSRVSPKSSETCEWHKGEICIRGIMDRRGSRRVRETGLSGVPRTSFLPQRKNQSLNQELWLSFLMGKRLICSDSFFEPPDPIFSGGRISSSEIWLVEGVSGSALRAPKSSR